MKIQIGEVYMDKVTQQKTIYPNKTRKYLLPCLREYGEVFINKINNVFKVAVGIGDIIVDLSTEGYERHIFILIDTTIATKFFLNFIDWIRVQHMYEEDYVYDNIQKSSFHMVVLKFPEKYYDSFETFKKGKYSEMFNKETIAKFFVNHPDAQAVFIKDHNYRIKFTRKLNIFLNNINEADRVKPEEWEGEVDFPPTDETEKFNHHLKK